MEDAESRETQHHKKERGIEYLEEILRQQIRKMEDPIGGSSTRPTPRCAPTEPSRSRGLYVYSGADASFQLYEDEGTNYNYEKGKYATIDIRYEDATKTVTFGKRSGSFNGMLKNRRFNIVLISKDAAKPLNLDNPEGKMVKYNGKEMQVNL